MDVAALAVSLAGFAATVLALYFGVGQIGVARNHLNLTRAQVERIADANEVEHTARQATLQRLADNVQLGDISSIPGAARTLEEQIAAANFIGARHSVRDLRSLLIKVREALRRSQQEDREAHADRITRHLALVGDLSDQISRQIDDPGEFATGSAREIVDTILDMASELEPANRMNIQ